jgi:hypothetical protein
VREAADRRRGDPRDLRRLLGRGARVELPAQPLQDRLDLDRLARRQAHLEFRLEGRAQPGLDQRAVVVPLGAGRPADPLGVLVQHAEAGFIAPPYHVGLAQEAPRVLAHQERQVGLLPHVVGVVEALGQDHLTGGER